MFQIVSTTFLIPHIACEKSFYKHAFIRNSNIFRIHQLWQTHTKVNTFKLWMESWINRLCIHSNISKLCFPIKYSWWDVLIQMYCQNGTSSTKATPRVCIRRQQPNYHNNYPTGDYMPSNLHHDNGLEASQVRMDRYVGRIINSSRAFKHISRTCELHTFSNKNVFNLGCCR